MSFASKYYYYAISARRNRNKSFALSGKMNLELLNDMFPGKIEKSSNGVVLFTGSDSDCEFLQKKYGIESKEQ